MIDKTRTKSHSTHTQHTQHCTPNDALHIHKQTPLHTVRTAHVHKTQHIHTWCDTQHFTYNTHNIRIYICLTSVCEDPICIPLFVDEDLKSWNSGFIFDNDMSYLFIISSCCASSSAIITVLNGWFAWYLL